MHFLTKFLVVVASVLSVLLAGLSVGLAFNAEAVTRNYEQIEANLAAAQGQLDETVQKAMADIETLENQNRELREERSDAMLQLTQTTSELERLNQELLETRRQNRTFEAELAGFRALLETTQEVDAERADEVRRLRESEIEYAMREIALTDQINELSSQLEVAQETNRSLLEEVAQLREETEMMASGVRPGEGTRGTRQAPRGFEGLVTSVRENPAGGYFVGINAGTQDGLTENMKLRVNRGSEFIATLVLDEVGLNDAVASVDVLSPGTRIQSGDRVAPAAR